MSLNHADSLGSCAPSTSPGGAIASRVGHRWGTETWAVADVGYARFAVATGVQHATVRDSANLRIRESTEPCGLRITSRRNARG